MLGQLNELKYIRSLESCLVYNEPSAESNGRGSPSSLEIHLVNRGDCLLLYFLMEKRGALLDLELFSTRAVQAYSLFVAFGHGYSCLPAQLHKSGFPNPANVVAETDHGL